MYMTILGQLMDSRMSPSGSSTASMTRANMALRLHISLRHRFLLGNDLLTSGGRTGLGLILSKRLGPFRGNFNVFYVHPGKGSLQNEILFASGIEFSATHDSDILAEFLARKVHFSKEYDQLEARFGYRLKTSDFIYTTVGVGTDLKARSPEYRLLFSVSFTNVKGNKKVKKIYEEE